MRVEFEWHQGHVRLESGGPRRRYGGFSRDSGACQERRPGCIQHEQLTRARTHARTHTHTINQSVQASGGNLLLTTHSQRNCPAARSAGAKGDTHGRQARIHKPADEQADTDAAADVDAPEGGALAGEEVREVDDAGVTNVVGTEVKCLQRRQSAQHPAQSCSVCVCVRACMRE